MRPTNFYRFLTSFCFLAFVKSETILMRRKQMICQLPKVFPAPSRISET
jgi:hypothetical protein